MVIHQMVREFINNTKALFHPGKAVRAVSRLAGVASVTAILATLLYSFSQCGSACAGTMKTGGVYTIDADVAGVAAGESAGGGSYSLDSSVAQAAGYDYSAGGSYILNGGFLSVLDDTIPVDIPQAITINTGWNLAGISKTGVTFDPAAVFSSGTYEIATYDGKYEFYASGTPINMSICDTYWIYAEADLGEITDSGTEITDNSYQISLGAGWVSFSIPFNDTLLWDDSAAALDCGGSAALPAVYSYDNDTGYSKISPNAGASLMPWTGYWLKLDQACTLTLSR